MNTPASVAAGTAAAAGSFELAPAPDGGLAAQGPLTFATARRARLLGLRSIAAGDGQALEIDCGAVTASDSAGLALLLDWLAVAHRAGRKLRYRRLPQDLAALARISEVEELLERGV
jgi:phospholipid transport system transporter-binding protein